MSAEHLWTDRLSTRDRLLHSAGCWCWLKPQYGPSRWWNRRVLASRRAVGRPDYQEQWRP